MPLLTAELPTASIQRENILKLLYRDIHFAESITSGAFFMDEQEIEGNSQNRFLDKLRSSCLGRIPLKAF